MAFDAIYLCCLLHMSDSNGARSYYIAKAEVLMKLFEKRTGLVVRYIKRLREDEYSSILCWTLSQADVSL